MPYPWRLINFYLFIINFLLLSPIGPQPSLGPDLEQLRNPNVNAIVNHLVNAYVCRCGLFSTGGCRDRGVLERPIATLGMRMP